MTNQAYINGSDIWLTYKANLVKGAYKALMKMPSSKTWVSNKSRLEDGTRIVIPDGEGLRLSERDVKLTFCVEGKDGDELAENFNALLKACAKEPITLRVPRLGAAFHLVYKQTEAVKFYERNLCRTAEITFTEPDPSNRA